MVIVYRVMIKKGKVEDFIKLANMVLIPAAKDLRGCQKFSFLQNISYEHEFIFYEEWDSEKSVKIYKQKLIDLLGPARPGEEFPESMNKLIESDEDIYISQ